MAKGEASAMPIVDAHQHFWDIEKNYYPWLCDSVPIPFRYGDYSALRRNYLPPDYARDSAGFDIVKTVHMEAEWDRADPVAETRWLEAVNREFGLPSACIGHAEPDRPDIEQVLAGHAKSPLMRGIRHKPKAARDPRAARRGEAGSMDDPVWRKGYALLWRTQIVINHTGLPADRSREGLAAWRRALEAAAAQPNVAIKISGLGRAGLPWTVEANGPIIRDAIAIFGVERCLFASNYPVDSLAGTFDAIYRGFLKSVADLPPADQRKLFHDNAVRIYRL